MSIDWAARGVHCSVVTVNGTRLVMPRFYVRPNGRPWLPRWFLERAAALVPIAEDRESRSLDVAYHPGFACNLGCTYCYQLPEIAAAQSMKPSVRNSERLSSDELAEFVSQHAQSLGFEVCRLTFLGGEPTLYMENIEKFAESVADRIQVAGTSMITNAVLIDQKLRDRLRMLQCMNLQITLDGHNQFHDRFRSGRDGAGTYQKVINRIRELTDDDFAITVRVNITSENMTTAERVLDDLDFARQAPGVRVYFALIDDTKWYSDSKVESEATVGVYRNLHYAAASRGFAVVMPGHNGSCDTCRPDWASNEEYIPGGLVLSGDGGLYSCWDSAGQLDRKIGDVRSGFNRPSFEERWVQCGYQGGREGDFKRLALNAAFLGIVDGERNLRARGSSRAAG